MIGYESTILLLTTLTLRQIVERDEDRSSAAEQRMNVATQRQLAKHPESFGLLVYYWAIVCVCAAFFDRDEKTTPGMCVDSVWIGHSIASSSCAGGLTGSRSRARPRPPTASPWRRTSHVIMCQMLVMLVLLWGRYCSPPARRLRPERALQQRAALLSAQPARLCRLRMTSKASEPLYGLHIPPRTYLREYGARSLAASDKLTSWFAGSQAQPIASEESLRIGDCAAFVYFDDACYMNQLVYVLKRYSQHIKYVQQGVRKAFAQPLSLRT